MKRLFPITPIVVLLIFSAWMPCVAGDDPDSLVKRGAVEMRLGNWAAAETLFLEALKELPADPDISALIGMTQYHLGKYNPAVTRLKFALDSGSVYTTRIIYYLGLAYSKMGDVEEASLYFERLITDYPDSPEAQKVGVPEAIREKPSKPPEKSSFSFVFLQDASYDSNAELNAGGASDATFFTFASLLWKARPAPINFKASFSSQNYLEITYMGTSTVSAGVEAKLPLGDSDLFKPGITWQNLWLNGVSYEQRFRGDFLWEREWGGDFVSDVAIRYGNKDYASQTYEGLTGDGKYGRVRAGWKFGESAFLKRARVYFTASEETADNAFNGYQSWFGGLDFGFKASSTTIDIDLGIGEREYLDVHPDYGVIRYDQRFQAILTVMTPISDVLQLRLNAMFLTSDSNIGNYTYDETVLGLGVLLEF